MRQCYHIGDKNMCQLRINLITNPITLEPEMAALNKEVLPAIIASDQAGLDEMLDRVKDFAGNIMLDLMDGKLVQASSLDFPMRLPKGPRYQFHVMAVDPIQRLMVPQKRLIPSYSTPRPLTKSERPSRLPVRKRSIFS